MEEINRCGGNAGACHGQMYNMGTVLRHGSEAQKRAILPKIAHGELRWHQDSPLWPTLAPKDQQISVWVALDDAEADNGCMFMVPGSHAWGNKQKEIDTLPGGALLPTTFEGNPVYFVMCPVKKGHVHFHHSLTWHGSPANRSERTRRGYAIHYIPSGVVFNGIPDARVKIAGIETPGTPMLNASQDWFPVVYDRARHAGA